MGGLTEMAFQPKTCIICGTTFVPGSGVAKTCSDVCSKENSRRYNEKYHIEHYERTGYNQTGTNCNGYKSGIGIYREIADQHFPKLCNRCGSTVNLCVHHKDRNRENNDPSNLERICRSCHFKEHVLKSADGKIIGYS
jgi:hypothetical protein